jgi:hypothetical protein
MVFLTCMIKTSAVSDSCLNLCRRLGIRGCESQIIRGWLAMNVFDRCLVHNAINAFASTHNHSMCQ